MDWLLYDRDLVHEGANDIIIFFQMCKSANYADDCTMYSSDKNINSIMISWNHNFAILANWFYKNVMVHDSDKYFFILFGVKDELPTDLVSDNITIKNSKDEKVLGITFQNKFDFFISLALPKRLIKLNNLTKV